MRYYVYKTADGELVSNEPDAYATLYGEDLPDGWAEKSGEDGSIWNPVTREPEARAKRFFSPGDFFLSKFSREQRIAFIQYGESQAPNVWKAFNVYSNANIPIWLDHPDLEVTFLDELVAATDIPFSEDDKAAVKA